MAITIVLAVFALFLLIVVLSSLFTVQSGEAAVVQRFGKFHRTAGAGLGIKVPFIETKMTLSLRVQQADLSMETKTRDNVFVSIPVSIQYSVDPRRIYEAVYTLSSPRAQMEAIVNNILLGHIPSMEFDEVYSSQPQIAMWVKAELEKEMNPVGYNINRVLVTDIVPSPQVRQAMDAINIANRNQVSARAQGEAERIKVVAAATAQAEAKKLQGEGIANERIAIAKGFREAIELIKESAGISGDEAYTMLLFTNWTDMLSAVGTSPNSTVVFVPSGPDGLADFQQQMMNVSVAGNALSNRMGGVKR